MFKSLKNQLQKVAPLAAFAEDKYRGLTNPLRRWRYSILFAVLHRVLEKGTPPASWLVAPTFVLVWLAEISRLLVTAYSLYLAFFQGVHFPFWISVLGFITSQVLVVALAVTKMEMQHQGYLTS